MPEPAIVFLALVDGLNVCSLTLLAVFISLMYTANAARRTVVLLGGTYIAGVFTSYLATGLGILLLSISLPVIPHFLSRIGLSIMLFVGAANILNYFRPGTINLMIPTSLGSRAISLMKSGGALPVTFAGVLTGFHNFPCACTGGIYMTFISLVAETPFRIPYLVVYNLLFIVPLAGILYTCSSKAVTLRMRKWYAANAETEKLAIGVVMVAVSLTVLVLIVSGTV